MSKIDNVPVGDVRFHTVRRWQTGPEWRPTAHSHTFCEIVIVINGTERAVVGGIAHLCEAGHVLFYPPGCVHEERQFGEQHLEIISVAFEWSNWPRGTVHVHHDRHGRLQDLARWLLSEEQAVYPSKTHYQDIGAQMVAVELLRLIESPPQDILTDIHSYIHEHLDEPITLDDLSACARLNKFQLLRVFRARTGMTPMQYVRKCRLALAYLLAVDTDLPLREIAPRVGFANEFHLSRLFKGRYGHGVRELRRIKAREAEDSVRNE